jgi:hypothetical protein
MTHNRLFQLGRSRVCLVRLHDVSATNGPKVAQTVTSSSESNILRH